MKKFLMIASFIFATTMSHSAYSTESMCVSIYELNFGESSNPQDFINACTKHCGEKGMKYSNFDRHGKGCPESKGSQFTCFCN